MGGDTAPSMQAVKRISHPSAPMSFKILGSYVFVELRTAPKDPEATSDSQYHNRSRGIITFSVYA